MGCCCTKDDFHAREEELDPLQPEAPMLLYAGKDPRLCTLVDNYETARIAGCLRGNDFMLATMIADLANGGRKKKDWEKFFTDCRELGISPLLPN